MLEIFLSCKCLRKILKEIKNIYSSSAYKGFDFLFCYDLLSD